MVFIFKLKALPSFLEEKCASFFTKLLGRETVTCIILFVKSPNNHLMTFVSAQSKITLF